MSLPNPAELLPRMASDLRAHLAERGIERPRFVGIHTGGIWVAEALLRELGNQEPLGTLDVSFYRDDFTQNGLHPQVRPSALPFEIDGQHLVLVDDGSPDGCGAICDDYAARDSRVRVIHQENQGQAAARNRALAVAKGEWVCFVDSDDAVHPQMLERLGQAAAESGAAMSMCRMLEAPEMPEDFSAPVEVSWELLSMEEAPLTALFDA